MITNRSDHSGMNSGELIAVYLLAIVVANLIVAEFGQKALVITAIMMIPLDMLIRDVLHHRWAGSNLWARMTTLVLSGSLCTILANTAAIRVVIASATAFFISGMIDAAMYQVLKRYTRAFRMNASNLVCASADSLIFPMIAFGGFNAYLSATQAGMKFIAGVILTQLFFRYIYREAYERRAAFKLDSLPQNSSREDQESGMELQSRERVLDPAASKES